MSFGFSIGDGVLLTQLAWRVVQGTLQACGEYAELTREARSLHKVFERLRGEISRPESALHRADDVRKKELGKHLRRAERMLEAIDGTMVKYNEQAKGKGKGKGGQLLKRYGSGAGK